MNATSHPAFQAAPAAGPPRAVRIGSLCENYIIWTALTQGDCVNVLARLQFATFTLACMHKRHFASRSRRQPPLNPESRPWIRSIGMCNALQQHVCFYLELCIIGLISLRLMICACCSVCSYSSVIAPRAQVRAWMVQCPSSHFVRRLDVTEMQLSTLLKNTELVCFVFIFLVFRCICGLTAMRQSGAQTGSYGLFF